MFPFHCCWRRPSCQQYRRVLCCHGNAAINSLYTVVQQRHVLYWLKISSLLHTVCVFIFCLSYQAYKSRLFCTALYYHLGNVRLYHISPHNLINGTPFGKKINKYKISVFSLQVLSQIFIFLRTIQRNNIKYVHKYLRKVLVTLVRV